MLFCVIWANALGVENFFCVESSAFLFAFVWQFVVLFGVSVAFGWRFVVRLDAG